MAPLPELHFVLRYDSVTEDYLWFRSRVPSTCSEVRMFDILEEMEVGDRAGDYIEAILDLKNDTDTSLVSMLGIGDEYFSLSTFPLHFVNFTDMDDEVLVDTDTDTDLSDTDTDTEISDTDPEGLDRRLVMLKNRPGVIYDTVFQGVRIRELYLDGQSHLKSVGAGVPGLDGLFIYIEPGSRTRLKARWWIDQSRKPAIVRNLL